MKPGTLGEFREKTKGLSDDVIMFVEYDCSYNVRGDIYAGVVLDGNEIYKATGRAGPWPVFNFLYDKPEGTAITAISIGCGFEDGSEEKSKL